MTQDGVVDGTNGVFFPAGFKLRDKRFLAAGSRAVGKHSQCPRVVDQCTGDGRVVDIHGLALLNVVAAGDAVVGVEETGIDAGDDLLALRTSPGAYFRQGLTELLAIVVVTTGKPSFRLCSLKNRILSA